MSQPNYELKAKVISNGMLQAHKKYSKTCFLKAKEIQEYIDNGVIVNYNKPLTDEELEQYEVLKKENKEEWQECCRVNNSQYHRITRLRKRIEKFIHSGDCLFLTLTFRDDVLDVTSQDTRRKYVTRALKSMSSKYVANIDYGKENEREHYHAVVIADSVNQEQWLYGNLDWQRVRAKQGTSDIKLAKYIDKLTLHAIKETVKQNRLIYSKL